MKLLTLDELYAVVRLDPDSELPEWLPYGEFWSATRTPSELSLVCRQVDVPAEASAERGESFLVEMLDTDEGARRLGELGIGTNYGIDRGTRSVLLDEKIGGTIHLAVGASYPDTGGTNQSAVHSDMVCDLRPDAGGGAIYADGQLIHENGQWQI